MSNNPISELLPVPDASPGVADIIGFGMSGVIILRNSFQIQTSKVINNFGYNAGGWRVEKHVRLIADTTGDKQGDVVGFGENGVLISLNKGNNTFQDPPKLVLGDFSYSAGGWRVEKHIRYMADIRGSGRADIVGFGDRGVLVSLNNGGGSFSPAQLALNDLGYDQGWRLEKHLRFLADVSGNKLLDIVGFGENGVVIANNKGDGTFGPLQRVLDDFCYSAGGWRVEKHPRFLADLTGDGKADIIGFGDAGVYVSLNNGGGKFGPVKKVIDNFAYNAGGWRVEKHPRCIADLTGNKRGDIVGFGDAGVYISINNGDGTFGPVKRVIDNFGYSAGGWRVEKHLRFAVDLTGNGCADIIGFGENTVFVSYNDGNGNFGPVQGLLADFCESQGWTRDRTVRWMANLYA